MMGAVRKVSGILMLLLCLGCSSVCSNDEKVVLNFDKLFPETPFKVVLDRCMEVYGDIDSLSGTKYLLQDYDLLNDAIIGRLFQIRVCMENIKNQRPCVPMEDVEYLQILLESMLSSYKNVFRRYMNKPKSGYVISLIEGISKRLQVFLSA